jgi:uncharacterized membrane protein YbhN (UPF0104 family)
MPAGRPQAMTTAEPGAVPHRSTLWWAVRVVPGLVALAVAVQVLASRRNELSGAATALARLNPVWVVVGAAAECASLAAYVFLQRALLDAGGAQVALTPLAGITLAGYAIQNSLPAGPAWSAVFAFRELRRRGADSVQAGWTMVVTALLSDAGLAFLGLVGVVLAHGQAAELDLVEVVAGVAVVTVLVAVAVRRGLLSTHGVVVASLFVALWRRLTRRPTDDASAVATAALNRLRSVRPSGGTWAAAGGLALGNWVLDCACLALCFVAVHAGVPWRGLLLAYGTAQLAANIPITPGGLGVVEGSLSIALVYYGGAQVSTVAAVLLYRLISFWALLPVGWASWVALRWTGRQGSAALVEEGAR